MTTTTLALYKRMRDCGVSIKGTRIKLSGKELEVIEFTDDNTLVVRMPEFSRCLPETLLNHFRVRSVSYSRLRAYLTVEV